MLWPWASYTFRVLFLVDGRGGGIRAKSYAGPNPAPPFFLYTKRNVSDFHPVFVTKCTGASPYGATCAARRNSIASLITAFACACGHRHRADPRPRHPSRLCPSG